MNEKNNVTKQNKIEYLVLFLETNRSKQPNHKNNKELELASDKIRGDRNEVKLIYSSIDLNISKRGSKIIWKEIEQDFEGSILRVY